MDMAEITVGVICHIAMIYLASDVKKLIFQQASIYQAVI